MLDDGSRYDNIGGAIAKRKTVRRRIGDDFVIEPRVAAQLLLGDVQRDDQMRVRCIEIGQEWALLTPADIEDDLSRPAVEQLCNLVLIKGLNVTLEHWW